MGYFRYFTQHLIQIFPKEEATVENYKRIGEAIHNTIFISMYSHLLIHDGIMDDSNYCRNDNGYIIHGAGSKYWDASECCCYTRISEYVPDLTICFTAIEEYGCAQECTMKGGNYAPSGYPIDLSKNLINYFYDRYGVINSKCYCAYGDDSWLKDLPNSDIPRYK